MKTNFMNNLSAYIEFLSKGEYVHRHENGRGEYFAEIQEIISAFYASDLIDYEYMRTAPELMQNLSQTIDTLTLEQVKSCITFVIRSEHFGEGLLLGFLENGTLLSLCKRLLDLQN